MKENRQSHSQRTEKVKDRLQMSRGFSRTAAVCFWILVWQLVSMMTRYHIFLASPVQTLLYLIRQLPEASYWKSVGLSAAHIFTGFLAALVLGSLLAAAAAKWRWIDVLIAPVMRLVRTVPVVSFIILALIFLPSGSLSVLISALMGLPMVYSNLSGALMECSPELEEMAAVFRVQFMRRLRYLVLPQIYPSLERAALLALGYAWKSGTAAEVIGMTGGSIGWRLQQAKLYLDTPELFAWTITVVLCSIASEKIMRVLLRAAYRYVRRMS